MQLVADDILDSWDHAFAVQLRFCGGPCDGHAVKISSVNFTRGARFYVVRDKHLYSMVMPWQGDREVWLHDKGKWKGGGK